MLFLYYGEDREGSGELREAHTPEHLAYLDRHSSIIVLGGALLAEDGETRIGSSIILKVRDRATAEAFAESEPLRRAGVFRHQTLTLMRKGRWNPWAMAAF